MSDPWMKFYPTDWQADSGLRICSLQARGLWIELLAIMHKATPRGDLVINGIAPSDVQIAGLVGVDAETVAAAMRELEAAGVFSRRRNGIVFSRRMVRDENRSRKNRENGKMGGNPTLRKQTENEGSLKPQKPEARSQIPKIPPDPSGLTPHRGWDEEASGSDDRSDAGGQTPLDLEAKAIDAKAIDAKAIEPEPIKTEGTGEPPGDEAEKPKRELPGDTRRRGCRLPDDFVPDPGMATAIGLPPERYASVRDGFLDYWRAKPGAAGRKLDWPGTWRNWVRREVERLGRIPRSATGGGQAQADVDLWRKRLKAARHNRTWPDAWGPPPNAVGCRVPAGLIDANDGDGWREWRAA